MVLVVHTARINYAGDDRLDITRKTGVGHGLAFAPSWKLLGPVLARRRAGRENGTGGALMWDQYVRGYTEEMRASYRTQRESWDWLLELGEVTLVCYCTDAAHCHRRVLAGILTKLGAAYHGERPGAVAAKRGR